MAQPRLSLRRVSASYGRVRVLHDIDLEIMPGEVMALLGSNGAGKSTTLRCISGLVRTSGVIEMDGVPIGNLPTHQIVQRGVAHVAEGRQLFPEMTVTENLQVGATVARKDAARRLEEMLDRFQILRERARQPAGTLSGGEQQILAIARALMSAPKLILLDEPSMGLSPVMVERLAAVIKDLTDREMTILLVEQNASVALALAGRAYVLETGRIVASGTTEDMRTDPALIRAYLGAAA